MKLKLDENLGQSIYEIFRELYTDVETVLKEKLNGASDSDIYLVCKREQRILITLDWDFSNILRFPLQGVAGIIIFKPSQKHFNDSLQSLARITTKELQTRPIRNRLWIVQPDKIRVRPALTVLPKNQDVQEP